MILSTIGTGLVGGFAIYLIGMFLLDSMIVGTSFADDILTFSLPIAIASGIIISILKHTFFAKTGAGGRM